MEPQEVAEAFVSAFNAGNYDESAAYLSEDFTFSGPVPEPIGAQEWIGMAKAMKAGIPDLDFHMHTSGADGNVVNTGSQLTGTHSADLDLSPLGLGVISATGKSFETPHETGSLTVEGDKIAAYHVEVAEGGGLMGILAQLGVEPPAA